jgi:hypothetical protein
MQTADQPAEESVNEQTSSRQPLATLFAIPKSFEDPHTALIQRNAIRSWQQLAPGLRVVLMGDDPGVAEIAQELSLTHVANLRKNETGTPLLNDAFAQVNKLADTPLIIYVNSDIILLPDCLATMQRMMDSDLEKYLVIGRRIDCDIDEPIDIGSAGWRENLVEFVKSQGVLAAVVCKDYFVFPRGQFSEIPAFSVGRGNWDNWMVASAHQEGIPVIDATNAITAIHQNHDYAHLKGGRRAAYLTGVEARQNLKLAGGSNLISGCNSNLQFHGDADEPKLIPVESMPFWSDLPKFFGLVKRLIVQR